MRKAARRAVLSELQPGEKIVAEGSASFLFTDGVRTVWPEVHVVVTEQRVIWAMVKRPAAGAPSMRFAQVARHTDDGERVELTERDPAYALSLGDPSNPYGETDAVFVFRPSKEASGVRRAIAARIPRKARDQSSDRLADIPIPQSQVADRITVQPSMLAAGNLDDVPETVRIGSPYDAPDEVVLEFAQRGVLHPQTNYGVVYRVAFAARMEPREQPITMRTMFATSQPASSVARHPTLDDSAWLLITSRALRWHFVVDGVPGPAETGLVPRPDGPRNAEYASLRPIDLGFAREFVGDFAGPFGGAAFDFFGFQQSTASGDWSHAFGLAPGFETDALMNEIHERIAFTRDQPQPPSAPPPPPP